MAEIDGVVTNAALEKWAKADTNEAGGGHHALSYFKIGEGGWIDPGGGAEPRTPDPNLTDVDAIENPDRYPGGAEERYVFQKSFAGTDLTRENGSTVKARCFLDFGDANSDGVGNPDFWEIGIFDTNDVMIAYGTFPKETKSSIIQIEKFVRIYRG